MQFIIPRPRIDIGWLKRGIAVAAWSYLVLVLTIWVLLQTAGDHWWLATLFLFGPRWVWAVPLGILVPAALAVRRRSLWVLLNSMLVVFVPVMGFCVPWQTWWQGDSSGPTIRVLTCNKSSMNFDAKALARLIRKTRPDIVAIQEWSPRHEKTVLAEGSWHIRKAGELCLASRYPIREIEVFGRHIRSSRGAVACYEIEVPDIGILRFVNLHLISARDGLEAAIGSRWQAAPDVRSNIVLRWCQSEATSQWVKQMNGNLLIAGDFNLPVESEIYRRYWSQFSDAFSTAGLGFGHTWSSRWHGIRIDHILAGPGWRFRRCWIGPDVGSDHRPVLADVQWVGVSDLQWSGTSNGKWGAE